MHIYSKISKQQVAILLFSILIVALCGIAYQLIISTVSSYLLGNSVYQFSLTIGLFMFSMGVGSYLSKLLGDNAIQNFISVEIAISLFGGISSLLLLMSFPYVRALYDTVMFGLIFIIGALVGMEIPILTGILAKKQSMRDSIANVMSLDYVGGLIGAVAFPLLLLPHLGLLKSSFAIGLVNIITALINIHFFREYLTRPRLMTAISVAVLIMLTAFTVYGTRISSFAEKHLYFDQIIYKKQTPYQRIVVTQSESNKENRLYIDGHIQFSSRDEYRYHESLVHPLMSIAGSRENVLILGGGDGLAIREVLKYDDVKLIHLVDIDPEMTDISSTLPMLTKLNENSFQHEKVTVYNEDAFSFINQAGILYDRVIIDMPDPHNEAINKLYSREFYRMIRKRMSDQGFVVSQSSSPYFTHKTFWGIEKTLDSVFDTTLSYHVTIPSFGIWGFNLASAGTSIPESFQFNVDTRFINEETMQAAMVFPKDTQKIDVPVNSIMEPKLYQLYLEDLRI
ncbi:polyamine aminopropyltransferase [Cocleimonas sp. KMM 6892]|uniref:polyamine aminopropyltransferase n=1 Tax=unclassified Cocleimonas TaxID=2639732 RepID=UPI002DBB9F54|nr:MULTISPECIES: polyamine aminopropyltransferase [unclassified Cocleimonas]MEB8432291.1 polyamine aminopropyltransferase [Cocleimonas sp. KMM 6892]MEC4714623.1 polyamine aminopropyltransferase [Cocleimonas sp. KMM 6895]MEC4744563.1 polyamine aminopropyltransferase [Cocleimonas sp. KMM 6896]